VRELHAGNGAVCFDEAEDARERFHVLVAVDTKVHRTDAAIRRHRRCFRENEARTSDRAAPQVDEMPVVRESVDARVLAHRRDDDPVSERDAPDRGGAEERRHQSILSYDKMSACCLRRRLWPRESNAQNARR